MTAPPAHRKRRALTATAAALVAGCGSTALAQAPVEAAPLSEAASFLHGACARGAARVLADQIAAPLARQGHWLAAIESTRRAGFRTVQDAVASGRSTQETFLALYEYAGSAEAAQRYDAAIAAADEIRGRYLVLTHLLEGVYPVLAFERSTDAAIADTLSVGTQLLGQAVTESREQRSALAQRRLTAGVDYLDETTLRGALDGARSEYQQCVLAGTRAAAGRSDTSQPTPEAVGVAARCALAITGEPRPTALPDAFRPSRLLAAECPAVLDAAPQLVAQAETLLAQRRQNGSVRASTPPAALPARRALSEQVLSPRQMRAWLGRAYAAEMYCHREAASVYQAAFAPFIDAAEAVARASVDRELEARVTRAFGELERRLASLDNVLTSAISIDNGLETYGERGVSDPRTALTNLTAGARNQRDAFEHALVGLDLAALEAERSNRLAEIAARYADERDRLAEWRSRFDAPPDPHEHPVIAGNAAAVTLDFPYSIQQRDRALGNGVLGAANAANARLNACRVANAAAAALVRPAPQSGVCDAWPPRDPFARLGFVRATERATIDRCSVEFDMLGVPIDFTRVPQDEAELARLAGTAARVAAATPTADLAAAIARVEALTTQFNERLAEADARLAAIRAKLAAGEAARLAAVDAPPAEPADDTPLTAAETATPEERPRDMNAVCLAREAEERAAQPAVLGLTVFVRYDGDALLQRWAVPQRPDGRVNTTDPCQVVHCPAGTETYEHCLAYARAEREQGLLDDQRRRRRDGWERLARQILDYGIPGLRDQADRFYKQARGDTPAERGFDRLVTLGCTMSSLHIPIKKLLRVTVPELAERVRQGDPIDRACNMHFSPPVTQR